MSRYFNPQTSPEKAFRGSKHLLTRYLGDFGCLGYIIIFILFFQTGKKTSENPTIGFFRCFFHGNLRYPPPKLPPPINSRPYDQGLVFPGKIFIFSAHLFVEMKKPSPTPRNCCFPAVSAPENRPQNGQGLSSNYPFFSGVIYIYVKVSGYFFRLLG